MALFAITGTYGAAGLQALARGSAVAMEREVAAAATRVDGRLERLFFVAGTFSVTAIISLPNGRGPALLTLALMASGMVEPGAEIVRLLDADEMNGMVPG